MPLVGCLCDGPGGQKARRSCFGRQEDELWGFSLLQPLPFSSQEGLGLWDSATKLLFLVTSNLVASAGWGCQHPQPWPSAPLKSR